MVKMLVLGEGEALLLFPWDGGSRRLFLARATSKNPDLLTKLGKGKQPHLQTSMKKVLQNMFPRFSAGLYYKIQIFLNLWAGL